MLYGHLHETEKMSNIRKLVYGAGSSTRVLSSEELCNEEQQQANENTCVVGSSEEYLVL